MAWLQADAWSYNTNIRKTYTRAFWRNTQNIGWCWKKNTEFDEFSTKTTWFVKDVLWFVWNFGRFHIWKFTTRLPTPIQKAEPSPTHHSWQLLARWPGGLPTTFGWRAVRGWVGFLIKPVFSVKGSIFYGWHLWLESVIYGRQLPLKLLIHGRQLGWEIAFHGRLFLVFSTTSLGSFSIAPWLRDIVLICDRSMERQIKR